MMHALHIENGCNVALVENVRAVTEYDEAKQYSKNLTCIMNSTAMRHTMEKIMANFDRLYRPRAFVHWFVGEGMESGEFAEAREDMGFLTKDYIDVMTECVTDEDDYDDDDDW